MTVGLDEHFSNVAACIALIIIWLSATCVTNSSEDRLEGPSLFLPPHGSQHVLKHTVGFPEIAGDSFCSWSRAWEAVGL